MKHLRRLSIRARIGIGTVLMALAVFTVVGLLVHAFVERLVDDAASSLLASDLASFATAIRDEPGDVVDVPAEGQLVAVVDPTGTVQVSTLPVALQNELGDMTRLPKTPMTTVVEGSQWQVLGERVTGVGGTWTVVAARSEGASEVVMARLDAGLLVGIGLIVLVFAGASWLVTGASLRPVTRLRHSAEGIVASGSQDLLPVGPARDEISALAETLNGLISDLRSSAARERQMVSDASHELRTPLAVLQAQLELIRAEDPDHLRKDLDDARAATGRLAHLVAELLELSRLEAGEVSRHTSSVVQLVEEVGLAVDRARLAAGVRVVRVELDVGMAPDAGGQVAVRREAFGRIAENLVSNALAIVESGGYVGVTVLATRAEFALVVDDDGPGIDPDFLPRAFDRFSRPDSSARRSEGAGLGLAIVAATTEAAGGSVTLENKPDGGVRARVTLPFVRAAL
ncbi:HAMP domain-containing histidine kinase [Microbacterium schleiferi]|uniref:histidine kinase n=1 Tax=Microbacterium schleiferi TaxID=69362 RepID=A0A7S8MVE5_9MICO|nr:HAMP domain-containing sensor histidine kinase [Microbacterium schleiferi]QPE03912.1 HAMP domain-containing histidine kinase [Microbacterium schleiferi]